jgi:phospholipid transport system substrate-binding protein
MKLSWATLGALAALLLPAWPVAHAQTTPDAFVQQQVGNGVAILGNKALGDADRSAQMEALLTTLLDLRRMAVFTLGPAAHSSPASDVDAFVSVYRQFAMRTYGSEIGALSGQTLEVRGATERAPGDYIVTGFAVNSNNTSNAPIEVNFRVLDEGGKFAVVDVSMEGVWFAQMQREQFMAILAQNGGSIPKLTDRLIALMKQPPPTLAQVQPRGR